MNAPPATASTTHAQHHERFESAFEKRGQRIVDRTCNPRTNLDAVHLEMRRAECVEAAADDEIDAFGCEPLDPFTGRDAD